MSLNEETNDILPKSDHKDGDQTREDATIKTHFGPTTGRTGEDKRESDDDMMDKAVVNVAYIEDREDHTEVVRPKENVNEDNRHEVVESGNLAVSNDGEESMSKLVVFYATKSTIHGLPSTVAHTLYKGQREFWVLLVVVMGVALATAMTLQLKTYYEWPTVISIQESRMNAFDIPEVTVSQRELMVFNGKVSWEDNSSEQNAYIQTEKITFPGNCSWPATGQCHLDYLNRTETTRLMLASLDGVWVHPSDEIYPKIITDITGGICNTFKTSLFLKASANFNQESANPVPLGILLAVKPSYVLSGQRVGLQVTLHTKDNPPFPRRHRTPIFVGESCLIEYKKIMRKSLTTPYKSFIGEQCVDTTSPSFRNPLTRFDVYTKDTCLEECFVNFTISYCGCRYYLHPGMEEMCNVTGHLLICMRNSRLAFSLRKNECKCPPPCEETQFETFVSCSPISRPPFDMVHIEMVMASDMKTEIIQRPIYSMDSILASLGGLIGLFMGFSLVSLLEFVELIFIAITRCYSWRRNRKPRTKHRES